MLSEVRLWIRRYLRHIILAVSIGVFIGTLGLILPEFDVNIRIPVLQNILLVVILLSFITAIVSGIWYKIPYKRIQQKKEPRRWISAKIKGIDNSQFLMYHELLGIDFVDMMIELKSDLPFDIELNSLKGKAIVNEEETHSILVCSDNIKLPRHSSKTIKGCRLSSWTDCIKDFLGKPEDTYIAIQLRLWGEDDKHKKYELITEAFNFGV